MRSNDGRWVLWLLVPVSFDISRVIRHTFTAANQVNYFLRVIIVSLYLVWEPVFFNFGFIFVSSMGSVKLKPSSHIYRWILYWLFALIFGESSQYGNLSYRAVSANYPLYSSYSEENVMSHHAK